MLTTKNFRNKLIREAIESLLETGFNLKEYDIEELKRGILKNFARSTEARFDVDSIDDATNMRGMFTRLAKKSFADQEIPLESTNEDTQLGPDGRGAWKVTYVSPDKKDIGNDNFETEREARRFARALKRKGYNDVHVELGQLGEAYPDDFDSKAADAYWGDNEEEFEKMAEALKYEIDNVDLEGHSKDPEDYEYNMEHLLDALVGGLKSRAEDENAFHDMYKDLYNYGEKILAPKLKKYMGMVDEGYHVVPGINTERYQERAGLEGPFGTRSGKVVYYDPKEGKYYDSDSDMYLSHDEYEALNSNRNVHENALVKLRRLSGIK